MKTDPLRSFEALEAAVELSNNPPPEMHKDLMRADSLAAVGGSDEMSEVADAYLSAKSYLAVWKDVQDRLADTLANALPAGEGATVDMQCERAGKQYTVTVTAQHRTTWDRKGLQKLCKEWRKQFGGDPPWVTGETKIKADFDTLMKTKAADLDAMSTAAELDVMWKGVDILEKWQKLATTTPIRPMIKVSESTE